MGCSFDDPASFAPRRTSHFCSCAFSRRPALPFGDFWKCPWLMTDLFGILTLTHLLTSVHVNRLVIVTHIFPLTILPASLTISPLNDLHMSVATLDVGFYSHRVVPLIIRYIYVCLSLTAAPLITIHIFQARHRDNRLTVGRCEFSCKRDGEI